MALIRAVPLKDFLAAGSALSTCSAGTAFNLGGLTSGQRFFAGLHLTAVSTGRPFVMTVQSATASAFAAPSTQAVFVLSSAVGSTWATPVANLSTEHKWFRAAWSVTTSVASTAGSWRGLVYMGVR